ACQLILEASSAGEAGATYLLEVGSPVRIADLARQMIRLSGFEPDEDIAIVFTGLRPGEKLEEELVDDGERVTTAVHDHIRVVHGPRHFLPPGWLAGLQLCVRRGDIPSALRLLQQVVPGFTPSPQALASAGGSSPRPLSSAAGTAAGTRSAGARDRLGAVALAAAYTTLALCHAAGIAVPGRALPAALLGAQDLLIAALLLARRSSLAVSRRWSDRLVAAAALLVPLGLHAPGVAVGSVPAVLEVAGLLLALLASA